MEDVLKARFRSLPTENLRRRRFPNLRSMGTPQRQRPTVHPNSLQRRRHHNRQRSRLIRSCYRLSLLLSPLSHLGRLRRSHRPNSHPRQVELPHQSCHLDEPASNFHGNGHCSLHIVILRCRPSSQRGRIWTRNYHSWSS